MTHKNRDVVRFPCMGQARFPMSCLWLVKALVKGHAESRGCGGCHGKAFKIVYL